jgi:hypothetical protein
MQSETKTCQNCSKDFTIEAEDFGFYEKIGVPPPAWCPQCRLLRRMNWLAYRILYKRKCDFTGEDMITFYHPDTQCKVYKQDIWWSDKWDAKTYGRDYDFSKPFFDQFNELFKDVPRPALCTEYTTLTNSEYCNAASYAKNCYLCFKHMVGEDNAYTNFTSNTTNCLDIAYSFGSELCYEIVDVRKSFQTFFSQDCENCQNIYFSRDLVNCSDCFGCTSLRNKSYCMFNEQLTRDEYLKKIKEFDLGSLNNVNKYKKQAYDLSLKYPRRSLKGKNNVNVSGEYVYNSRNARNVYHVSDSENIKYCEFFSKDGAKNSYDFTYFGTGIELIYESTWCGHNSSNVSFAVWCYRNHDTEYTFSCHGCEYLFGCVGLKKASYCIFNKQYSKEEYFPLVEKIKKQMNEMPFVDKKGREHKYGGHIPVDLCPWAYNESTAYEFFPITKEEAITKGFTWRDPDAREYLPASVVVPEHIKDVTDGVLKEVLKCVDCGKNYQIIPKELTFLCRFNFPVPDHCPLCRDRSRIKLLNPMQIYGRKCDKCNIATETSYSPNSPEIVYCESCYKQEVY